MKDVSDQSDSKDLYNVRQKGYIQINAALLNALFIRQP